MRLIDHQQIERWYRSEMVVTRQRLHHREGGAPGPGFVLGIEHGGADARIHPCEFGQVLAGQLITVGEMPGVTVEQAQLFTDPARAEVDMVFQFEHVGLDHGPGGKFDPEPLRLTDLKASLGRWQEGLEFEQKLQENIRTKRLSLLLKVKIKMASTVTPVFHFQNWKI